MGSLRYGWTTGACATAATVAACRVLMGGVAPSQVTIPLKRRVLTQGVFVIHDWGWQEDGAFASVIKDAGDDPDVTDGAKVSVLVRRGAAGSGIVFKAGEGVGTVTKPGLALAVGEAAINDAPRRMMTDAIKKEMSQNDVCVTVSVADGERLAQRTMNAQLGIVGGCLFWGRVALWCRFRVRRGWHLCIRRWMWHWRWGIAIWVQAWERPRAVCCKKIHPLPMMPSLTWGILSAR